MSDSSKEQATEEKTEDKACSKGASYCRPHTSLYIAVIALLLGAYAAITAGADTSAVEKRVSELDSRIASVDMQIATLNKEVQSNREDLIQTKLKKALQNIQEIGNLAEEGTKEAIAEVEQMLQTLTAIGEQLNLPAETEPVAEPEVVPTEPEPAKPEAAPAESIQPEASEQEAAPADATTPELQPASEAISDTAEQPEASQETANSVVETGEAEADSSPETEPSMPQEF